MPTFKRYKGRRIKPGHPHFEKAIWWIEFRLRGDRVSQPVKEARTKAQAQRAETTLRESIYDGRYSKGKPVSFSSFVDNVFLPWAKSNKLSYADDLRRAKILKAFFRDRPLREILPLDIERLMGSLIGVETVRGTPRTGATVNRYRSLLSRIFSMAFHNGLVDVNPVSRVHKQQEGGKRERYLTANERPRLFNVLVNDLAFLRPVIEIARGAGLRKSELLRLQPEHVNLTALPIFEKVNGRDVEILPNFLLVTKSKNKKPRCVPMNSLVRGALVEAMQGAKTGEMVFTFARNGVSNATIRRGFEEACKRSGIVYGLTKSGGLVFHSLRHTFATRLRAAGVHELDIMQMLGHSTVGVTLGYARNAERDSKRS